MLAGCKLSITKVLSFSLAENGIFVRDNAHGRIIQTLVSDSPTMTVETCIQACDARNLTVAGLEFSSTSISFFEVGAQFG